MRVARESRVWRAGCWLFADQACTLIPKVGIAAPYWCSVRWLWIEVSYASPGSER